jgi:type I restriction enzyme S subunit
MNDFFEVPAGFKETEIGIIPEDWEVVKLGKTAIIIMGQSPPSETYNTLGKGTPFLQGKSEFGDISPNPVKYTTNPIKIARRGSVLISVRAPVGDVNAANMDYCIGRGLASIFLRNGDNLFLMFLLYFLKNEITKKEHGTTFKSINKSELNNLHVPLPPPLEQKQIAYVLSTVQDTIEKTEAVIHASKELKKSLLKYLFTYGLVSIQEKEKVVLKETEIGIISKEWDVMKLEKVSEILMGQSPQGKFYNIDSNGLPLINGPADYGNKFPKITKWTSTPTKICKKGDILFCVRGNTVGKLNISDAKYCIGRGVAAIRSKDRTSETLYIFYFFEKEKHNILQLASSGGSTFPNITKTQLKNLLLPVPNFYVQQKVVKILSLIDNKIHTEQNKKSALQQLFNTLLNNLMTGKIRVNHLEVLDA